MSVNRKMFGFILGNLLGASMALHAASGDLDLTFDGDGIITVNPGPRSDYLLACTVDTTGLYLGGGEELAGGGRKARIQKRHHLDGSLLWEKVSSATDRSVVI